VAAKLRKVPGVIDCEVSAETDAAVVRYDPEQASIEALKVAVAKVGYKVRNVREVGE
jgi:copper chaperone CopZ